MRIAVVGAGIGGLSFGLALRERGLDAEVFEQAAELTEIGAAIALSANATREYIRLGLGDALAAAGCTPTELIYRTGVRAPGSPPTACGWGRPTLTASVRPTSGSSKSRSGLMSVSVRKRARSPGSL